MKRAVLFIVIVALAFACCFAGCSRSSEFASKFGEKLSPAIEKVKGLLPGGDDADRAGVVQGSEEQADASGGAGGWPLPSLGGAGFSSGLLKSTDDVVLVPTDDYAQGYVFEYGGEQFDVYFDTYSWRVYNSYKITNHDDIIIICQTLLNEHVVYGSDWETPRTADDMAFEWEQHNLAYEMLPEDSHWREDAKDVDLDPDDQGKTFPEMYESRTGRAFDIRNYLPGD